MSAYLDFLAAKARIAQEAGFDVPSDAVNPLLKPHQRDVVQWACRGGRRAIFARFGLGKTFMQLEVMRLCLEYAGGRGLIVVPLGVRQEFARDARSLGIEIRFIRSPSEADAPGLYMTNYETIRDGRLDPAHFTVASLDEASVLRSYGSKTFQTFLTLFDRVRYRFVATATPSPNRHKELIHYAGFLGVMDTGQSLTRWFQRDPSKAGNLTLYPHKEEEFWLWVSSWAVFLQRPSDLGYSDEGYDLPPLRVHWHEVKTELLTSAVDRDGQGLLIKDPALSLSETAREKRSTLPARVAKLTEILAEEPGRHCLIWHDLEAEREAIEDAVPGVVTIWGAQDLEERERRVISFSDGAFPYFGTKPVLSGSGSNFQRHCSKAVFLGVGFKFNDFIQALHRIYRFLQTEAVDVHIIYAESEREVRRVLEHKWSEHDELTERMAALIKRFGLAASASLSQMTRSIGVERREASGAGWQVALNDCTDETARIETDSLDLIVTSIPFSNHYEYTPSYNDFGHTDDDGHFFAQMDFLTPELLRALKPGRLACVHVKDRILFGSVTGLGMPTVNPFHAKTLMHFQRHGFAYMGMITVVTDVVRENNQTYRLGWSEMLKDGTAKGVGSPEYILLMRKLPTDRGRSYADDPVRKAIEDFSLARWQVDAHAFWRSSGDRLLTPAELAALPAHALSKAFTAQTLQDVYSYADHVAVGEALAAKDALPKTFMALAPGSHHPHVWHDVNRMRTLNGEQTQRGLENHICPLQFDIVDRLINRFSAKGELVYDPFGGLFTVPFRALHLGRRGRAAELNPGYFTDGVKYLRAKECELSIPSLFGLIGEAA